MAVNGEEQPHESDAARDRRFISLNNETWGVGNWIRCSTCPLDATGREVFHHKLAHAPGITRDRLTTADIDPLAELATPLSGREGAS